MKTTTVLFAGSLLVLLLLVSCTTQKQEGPTSAMYSLSSPQSLSAGILAPRIRCHPHSQIALVGSNATFTVEAEHASPFDFSPLLFQWQRQGPGGTNLDNFVNLPGATNTSYTNFSCTTNGPTGPALFRVKVASTNGISVTSLDASLVVGENSTTNIVPTPVYGTPVHTAGNGCAGSYVGFVSFTFYPDHTGGIFFHNAQDLTRADTKVEAYNYYGFHFCGGPTGCPNTHNPPQTTPEIGPYVFTIYFPNNFPTGTYPIFASGYK
jgi:hypothetical protein